MGPTASGKSLLAESLADRLSAVLINADAFQVYRGLDIGTNKPSNIQRYRLIDIKSPNESFGLGEWIGLAHRELRQAFSTGRNVIVVGGTGLYVRALFEQWTDLGKAPNPELRESLMDQERREGAEALVLRLKELDAEAASRLDLANPQRVRRALERVLEPTGRIENVLPPFRTAKFALSVEVDKLNKRITDRTRLLLSRGWIEEVEALLSIGVTKDSPAMRAIGYRSVLGLIEGAMTAEQAEEEISLLTRQYAKRQRTWLRKEPNLRWLDADRLSEATVSIVIRQLEGFLSQAEK